MSAVRLFTPGGTYYSLAKKPAISTPNTLTVREYLEIAVLTLDLRPAAKPSRLIQLIHRAIPYPVVLVTQHGDTVNLSLAHKRWSQGEMGKTLLDGEVVAVEWNHERHESESSFLVFRGSKKD